MVLCRTTCWLRIAAALAAAGAFCAPAQAAAPVTLRIDYLPNLIYDGEKLTLCGSVVNRTTDTVRVRVSCSLRVGQSPLGKAVDNDLAPAGGKEQRFEVTWPIKDLDRPATLSAVLTVGSAAVQAETATVHPSALGLPELDLVDDYLVDHKGDRAVLVVRRQIRERETKWAVVKLVRRAVSGDKIDSASALFVGDLLADDAASSYVSRLRADKQMDRFSFLTVRHPSDSARAGCAVLRTLCRFSKAALKRRYDLALLFIGSDEARFGTDVEEFRKAIDLMSGQIKARGCQHVVFISPVAPRRLAARIERYRRVVESVAHAADAKVFDPQPVVARAGWGRGRAPGPEGGRALSESIVKFVKAITSK